MTEYERAFLDSKESMEQALCKLEDRMLKGDNPSTTAILRAVCRALFILLDWAIRREHERKL